MPDVVIVGAGGHGRELAEIAVACQQAGDDISMLGYVDDNPSLVDTEIGGLPVLGPLSWFDTAPAGIQIVVGMGMPGVKKRVIARLSAHVQRIRGLVHPSAILTKSVELSQGTIVTAGCVLTCNIHLGPHAHINRCATIGHDCQISAFCHVAPGAVVSGNVRLGEGADLGASATVLQNVTVGAWSVVGAGAVVTRDLPGGVVAVGIPAKIIRAAGDGG